MIGYLRGGTASQQAGNSGGQLLPLLYTDPVSSLPVHGIFDHVVADGTMRGDGTIQLQTDTTAFWSFPYRIDSGGQGDPWTLVVSTPTQGVLFSFSNVGWNYMNPTPMFIASVPAYEIVTLQMTEGTAKFWLSFGSRMLYP